MIPHAGTLEDAMLLAQAIVDTIPDPFLVLDADYRVLAASEAFHRDFKLDPKETRGRLLFALADGQWDIVPLRSLLAGLEVGLPSTESLEIEHDFPMLGHRAMLLNARKLRYEGSGTVTILLALRDITARRDVDHEKEILFKQLEDLLRQKQVLLQEMRHRVANSLQIIASILMLKARAVSSEETRSHLQDAHLRVMSVAAVQQLLDVNTGLDRIHVGTYLDKLCAGLATAMVGDTDPIEISVIADEATIASAEAVSLGLIVTELVINAIKYAFPAVKPDARILVTYEVAASGWKLAVSDNGIGAAGMAGSEPGLGTTIIQALAKQLGAQLDVSSDGGGVKTSVTRATFISRMPFAA
jgi:chemotaxis protein methyltransferase CheR